MMKNYGLVLCVWLVALSHSTLLQAIENPLLKSIPADTVFFSGSSQLIHITDYPLMIFQPSFDAPLSQSERDDLGKGLTFLHELFVDFKTVAQQGNMALQTHYGWPENIALVIYTVGVTPVIKMTVDNERALLEVLNKAEQKTGFHHSVEHFAQLEYRAYPISENHQLLVSIQTSEDGQKLATFALSGRALADRQKELIFGLRQPELSIADTGKVKAIEQENHYLPLPVSFVDFRELVKSLFQAKNNPWIEWLGDDEPLIASLQASGCEADVTAIVQEVPQIVAGYKHFQVQDQGFKINFQALLELKNKNVKTELNYFRGFIPDYIRNGAQDNIFAFGLGANLSQLSPLFFYVSKAFRESTFQCAALIKMQQDIGKINPAMMALMTGMVDGIQGVSFAMQEFKLSGQTIKKQDRSDQNSHYDGSSMDGRSVSLLMSLSAENPLRIWQLLAAFSPELALIVPSDKAQKLNSAELDALGIDVFVVLKGQHLVLYSGSKAEAISHTLTDEAMVNNGFFQETLNYTKLTAAVENLRDYLTSPSSQQALPAEACIYFDESIAMLSRFSGFVDFRSDFVSTGWLSVINADIGLNKQIKTNYHLVGNYETYFVQDGCLLAKSGLEEIYEDGTGFYQQFSQDGQCFIFETRYRWTQLAEDLKLQYVSERRRPGGICSNAFAQWAIPEPEFVNDVCQLRAETDNNFACLYRWDDVLNKAVYKRI